MFQVGEEMVEADSEEEESSDESQQHSAVLSLLLEEEHFHQPVLCTAENRATDSPLSSNTININIKRKQRSALPMVQIHCRHLGIYEGMGGILISQRPRLRALCAFTA